MRPCSLPSLLQETLVAPHRFLLDATQLLVARIWARKSFTSVAQDIRVLDFVGKRGLNHPSKTKDLPCSPTEISSSIPSTAPQNTVIVTVIEAESVEPINECPTCGQPRALRDHNILWCLIHAASIRHTINAFYNRKSHQTGVFRRIFHRTSHQIASKPAV
ncbi:hypothetical protein FRC0522_02123 [Corynebacterium diphtheriae]|nr:hypothetical protein FRC0522_02123 [Corynebacterium diphtheriae]